MKKATFKISIRKGGVDSRHGYTHEIEGVGLGFDRRGARWYATELTTGLLVCLGMDTRKQALAKATERLDKVMEYLADPRIQAVKLN